MPDQPARSAFHQRMKFANDRREELIVEAQNLLDPAGPLHAIGKALSVTNSKLEDLTKSNIKIGNAIGGLAPVPSDQRFVGYFMIETLGNDHALSKGDALGKLFHKAKLLSLGDIHARYDFDARKHAMTLQGDLQNADPNSRILPSVPDCAALLETLHKLFPDGVNAPPVIGPKKSTKLAQSNNNG